jgi:uncharacterized protein DUF6894
MIVPDEEGTELRDEAAARRFAIVNIRDLACGTVADGRLNLNHWLQVANEQGAELFSLSFADAITLEE